MSAEAGGPARRGEAVAPGPRGLGSLSSGSTSPPRRRRVEAAAAGERVRERASRVGEGRRPRREAKARGERARPPRARALAASSSRGRPRSLASPPPLLSVPVARGAFTCLPLPHGNGSRRRRLAGSRALATGGARASASRLPHACGRTGPPAATPFRHFLGGEAPALGARGPFPDPFPRASPAFGFSVPPGACGPARSLPDSRAPRSPLPHPSRPKIGLGGPADAGEAWN